MGVSMNSVLKDLNGSPANLVHQKDAESMQGRLITPGAVRQYILGGSSCFTIQGQTERRTYKVRSDVKDKGANWSTGNQDKSRYFVRLKTGPGDSFSDYQYIGMLTQEPDGSYRFRETAKSHARKGSVGFDMLAYLWNSVEQGCRIPTTLTFWHEGQCCICGRKLTVPESVEAGIGPECRGKVGV